MEASLSVLREARLERLGRTGCAYLAAGVESWADYSNKSASGVRKGIAKLEQVTAHFEMLRHHVKGFQANFVFGSDADRGHEPLELTKEFIRRLPYVWPGINIPTPFRGTPLFDTFWNEGRILKTMPFAFYYNPWLTYTPAHYDALEYYDEIIDLFSFVCSSGTWCRRLTSGADRFIKFIHSIQGFGLLHEMGQLKRIRNMLRTDSSFRAFHDGKTETLPEYYHHALEERLGPYKELISRSDRIPSGLDVPAVKSMSPGA